MTRQAEGKYSKPRKGGYARVLVDFDFSGLGIATSIDLDDHEWNQQLRERDFTDWLNAAEYGVRFGLAVAGIRDAHAVVRRIVGLLVDTSPNTVAAAAADACWQALGFVPSRALVAHIADVTVAGGKAASKLIPLENSAPTDVGSYPTEQPN